MRIALSIKGGAALAATLRAMPDAASKEIVIGALTDGGDEMAGVMATLMNRGPDAPHVADNVVVAPVSRINVDGITRHVYDAHEYAVAVGPQKDFYYWYFREYGTVYQPPHPAVRPGFDQTVDRALAIVVAVLAREIAAHASRGASASGAGNL